VKAPVCGVVDVPKMKFERYWVITPPDVTVRENGRGAAVARPETVDATPIFSLYVPTANWLAQLELMVITKLEVAPPLGGVAFPEGALRLISPQFGQFGVLLLAVSETL
jgi:hypothetical protein